MRIVATRSRNVAFIFVLRSMLQVISSAANGILKTSKYNVPYLWAVEAWTAQLRSRRRPGAPQPRGRGGVVVAMVKADLDGSGGQANA